MLYLVIGLLFGLISIEMVDFDGDWDLDIVLMNGDIFDVSKF